MEAHSSSCFVPLGCEQDQLYEGHAGAHLSKELRSWSLLPGHELHQSGGVREELFSRLKETGINPLTGCGHKFECMQEFFFGNMAANFSDPGERFEGMLNISFLTKEGAISSEWPGLLKVAHRTADEHMLRLLCTTDVKSLPEHLCAQDTQNALVFIFRGISLPPNLFVGGKVLATPSENQVPYCL